MISFESKVMEHNLEALNTDLEASQRELNQARSDLNAQVEEARLVHENNTRLLKEKEDRIGVLESELHQSTGRIETNFFKPNAC